MLIAPHTHKLSLQDCFTTAYLWIQTHERCKSENSCFYRNEEKTNACLIGCIIPDELYDKKFESKTIVQLISLYPNKIGGLFEDNLKNDPLILNKLQAWHDICSNKIDVITALETFAEVNKLTIPVYK